MGFFSRKKTAPADDVFELLKNDHRDVKQLFDEIQGRAQDEEMDGDETLALYQELRAQLTAHSRAEARVVYSELQAYDDLAQMILEAREEHALVDQLLDEVDAMGGPDEVWLAKVKVLRDLVEHHVEEEEGDQFPAARKVIDDERSKELAHAFTAAKTEELDSLAGESEITAEMRAMDDEEAERLI